MKTQLRIEGMSCEGCAGVVRRTLGALPGVQSVEVDLDRGLVTVAGVAGLAVASARDALAPLGYEVREM